MTISVEHFRPDPIIIISYLTSHDLRTDEWHGMTVVEAYKRKMGGRLIAIWDMSLIESDTSHLQPVAQAPQGYYEGLFTILIGDGPQLNSTAYSGRHVSTREEAIDLAHRILRQERRADLDYGTYRSAAR